MRVSQFDCRVSCKVGSVSFSQVDSVSVVAECLECIEWVLVLLDEKLILKLFKLVTTAGLQQSFLSTSYPISAHDLVRIATLLLELNEDLFPGSVELVSSSPGYSITDCALFNIGRAGTALRFDELIEFVKS